MSKITRSQLRSVPVPLPPLETQRDVAAQIGRQLAAVAALSSAVDAKLEAIDALPAALLRRAFAESAA